MPRYPSRAPIQSSAAAGGVAAVDRALMLLAAFREGDQALSLAELAERTSLVKSTALRLLASLQHAALIQKQHDGCYALAPGVARLHSVFAATFPIESEVMPILKDLAGKTNETAVFYVRQGTERLVLYRVESHQTIQSRVKVGDLVPLSRGSGGRVLSAFSGARGAVYDKIRRDGVAALVGDRERDLAGIAAPVFRGIGNLVGALTLTMPAHRFKKSHAVIVKTAAQLMTKRLTEV